MAEIDWGRAPPGWAAGWCRLVLLRDRYLEWLRRPELRDAVDYGAPC